MDKSEGVVELKGERVAFLFFLLKNECCFFFKGAQGLGFGHGVLLLIEGPRYVINIFLFHPPLLMSLVLALHFT